MNPQQAEQRLLHNTGELINGGLIKEVIAQGHSLTGALEKSVQEEVIEIGSGNMLTGTMAFYGAIVNAGTSPERIPYGGPSTGAKTSKYIQALKTYWMLRGLSEKEALSAAFATAKKQKREGMPTVASYAYSQTGQRRWFLVKAEQLIENQATNMISDGIDDIVDALFRETGNETY